MARPFHHGLATHFAADLGQFAVDNHLRHLGPVVAVVDGTGPDAVAQGKHRVILFHQVAHPIKLRIQGVLFFIHVHPGHHESAPFGSQAAVSETLFSQTADGVLIDAAVDGHEAESIGQLPFDEIEKILRIQTCRILIFAGASLNAW